MSPASPANACCIPRLNSHYQTGLKNLLDTAVLEGVDEESARQLSGRWQKIDEIPFDFERRRMSVVVAEEADVHQLVCKRRVAGRSSASAPGCATMATLCRWMTTCCAG